MWFLIIEDVGVHLPMSVFGLFKCSCLNRAFSSDPSAVLQVWRFKHSLDTRWVKKGKTRLPFTSLESSGKESELWQRRPLHLLGHRDDTAVGVMLQLKHVARLNGTSETMRYRKGPLGGRAYRKHEVGGWNWRVWIAVQVLLEWSIGQKQLIQTNWP